MEIEKTLKSILTLNIILAATVIVLLGLQVYHIADSDKKQAFILSEFENLQAVEDKADVQTSQQQNQAVPQMPQQFQQIPPQNINPSGQLPAGNQDIINKKCGDGVCDAVEKANQNLCPADCE